MPHDTICGQHDFVRHWSHIFVLVEPHETLTPQVPPLHVFEQHWLADAHCAPSGTHGGGGGGVGVLHVPLSEQNCEQHCCGEVHCAPSGLQPGAVGTHTVDIGSQSCEQHSLDAEHFE